MKLYVGNLPRLADKQALGAWFTRAGITVHAVELVRGSAPGTDRGYGVVQIEDANSARSILRRLNGRAFWGRVLVLREAE